MTGTKLRNTKTGSFHASEHIEFVKNKRRNQIFKDAFAKLAKGKVVLDVGTGSGIMAIFAARAGAKKVIAVEKDPVIAEIARKNFERNGLQDKIQLIVGDALDIQNFPKVDILIGELLSTWCIVEPQVPVFKHLLV
jgi:protein arginine N-methyltransferase 1